MASWKLKFRQKVNGEFIYLLPRVTIDGDIVLTHDENISYIDTYFEGDLLPELEQFTGLYDEKGEEIYEKVNGISRKRITRIYNKRD